MPPEETQEETLNVDNGECVALLEDVGAIAAAENDDIEDIEGETMEHVGKNVIKMLRDDGTIYEMEDNIVIPDNIRDESEDDDEEEEDEHMGI